ncbi:MAG: hypothetical protein MRJ65_13780 [Candidatus Brocadiaceae bacterium]|nr:hypothetical protein [Candidatus Brocadiaceae bacterium]
MRTKKYIMVVVLLCSCFLILHGYVCFVKYRKIEKLKGQIEMGRYQSALATIQEIQNSTLLNLFEKDDPVIAYNKGIIYYKNENKKKASVAYRKAMETKDDVLRAKAVYNNANIIADEMDFSSAALQYTEVLKIDENDFQAKKNLERMRLVELQFGDMFRPDQQEREDRIEALKLIPWGTTKYRHTEGQKLRW